MNQFTNKNILITGGLSGIGQSLAEHFKKLGANIYMTTSRKELINNQDIFYFDMSEEVELELLDGLNFHLDYFIHSAHAFSDTKLYPQINEEDLMASLSKNIGKVYSLTKLVLKNMRKQKTGKILFLGSYISINPTPGKLIYIIEKNAINGLALALSSELSKTNIKVKVIHPGLVDTAQIRERMPDKVLNHIGDKIISTDELSLECERILRDNDTPVVNLFNKGQEW